MRPQLGKIDHAMHTMPFVHSVEMQERLLMRVVAYGFKLLLGQWT